MCGCWFRAAARRNKNENGLPSEGPSRNPAHPSTSQRAKSRSRPNNQPTNQGTAPSPLEGPSAQEAGCAVEATSQAFLFHGFLALRFGFLHIREATFTAHRGEHHDGRFDVSMWPPSSLAAHCALKWRYVCCQVSVPGLFLSILEIRAKVSPSCDDDGRSDFEHHHIENGAFFACTECHRS